ncbi:helix-turn-helix domain-containing protein [Paenibacillus camelliae]|uniref:helix-turn-helix domain-containing protein n=1 Tax=Paenibacillus camelliae TaxID=512410 RepID=UPI0020419187|nr:helix-turn-helix domain-containing protein [Paenibacillus camelliae]MCM3633387.1 helix-turn-helix domain-containing protein [Paenibacillus camelliae]
MRSLNYFAKLTIFGCLLSTIPVIFIGIFAYVTSTNEIQKNVNEGKKQLIMQINSNVEQKLTTVNHTMNQVLASTVLKRAMSQSLTAADFMLYDDLRNEIRHMQSFDTKLEDVILLNQRHQWLVKNSGLYDLDQYEYSEQLLELMELPEYSSWVLTPSYLFYSEEFARNTAVCPYNMTLVKQLPANSIDTYGLALATIPTCSLQEMVEQNIDSSSSVIIFDDQLNMIIHNDQTLIGQSVEAAGIDASKLTETSGQYDALIQDMNSAVTYYKSPVTGWTYMSISSIEALTAESKKIGMYTLYICMGLIVLCIVLVWLGTKQFYSPIRRLLQQIGVKELGYRSQQQSSNEFQLISDRVHDLFQSKSELEHQLQQHIHQVRTLFFMKAYQGQIKPFEIRAQLKQFGYSSQLESWNTMAAITIQIDFHPSSSHSIKDIDLLLFALHNVVEEFIPAEQRLASVILDQSVVTVIGSPSTEAESFHTLQYSLTESLQQQIKQLLNLQISIGISTPFYELSGFSAAYREGLDALKHRMILGEGIIIQYDQLSENRHVLQLNYPQQLENELLDAIKVAEEDRAREHLLQLLSTIFQTDRSPQEFQFPLTRLLNNLVMMMQESGITIKQLKHHHGSLLEQLLKIQHKQEIERWFWKVVIHPLIVIYRDRQEEQYHKLSEKIIDLVQRYYDTDLTLEECASRLHYNANYLSSVFRKETNVSFSDYLTMYRFKMAKKWLSENDMPIKDIAAKLRYNNSQNFIRSFRKLEGMTPGQYRDKYKSQEDRVV